MNIDEKLLLIANKNDKLFLYVLEINELGYKIDFAKDLGFIEEILIHSILLNENNVYLTDSYNNKIYKFDMNDNNIIETYVGKDPRHMCIEMNNLYVTNFDSNNISIIDVDTLQLKASIPAGIKPHDIIYINEGDKLFVSCYEENQIIEFILPDEIKRYITIDGKPMHILIFKEKLIVMSYYTNGSIHSQVYTRIIIIDALSGLVEDTIEIIGLCSDFNIDYLTEKLFVLNIEDKDIYLIDLNSFKKEKKIHIGGYPECIDFGKKHIIITNSKKNQIIFLDRKDLTVSKTYELNFSPYSFKVLN